jgi:MFS family permease
MDLALLRKPRLLMIVLAYGAGTMVIAFVSFAASFMFLTNAKVVENAVIAAAAAKTHAPAALIARALTFRGDLSYAHGYTVIELAVRVLLWSSVTAMIFGPVGGFWARRRGPRPVLLSASVLLLIASVGLAAWHDTWEAQAVYGVVLGVGFGLFYASLPNLVIETVTPAQQAISSGVVASFGAVGSAFATALATAVLVHHPFQVIAATPTGQRLVTNIPQVYTNGGYGQTYLIVGGGGAVLTLIVALALWFTRRPATEV